MAVRVATPILLAAVVAGCGLVHEAQMRPIYAQAKQEIEQCNQRLPMQRGTAVANAQCVAEVQNRLLRPVSDYSDQWDVLIASRQAIAARLDRGEIRQEEAALAITQMRSEVASEVERRDLGHRAVRAQEGAGRGVVCTRSGNTTFCN